MEVCDSASRGVFAPGACRIKRPPTKILLVDAHPFADHFKYKRLIRPTDTLQQFVENRGRTRAAELYAVKPAGEIKQVAVDLPAATSIVARDDERSVQLEDHARQPLQQRGRVFPGDGKGRGLARGEDVDVESVERIHLRK